MAADCSETSLLTSCCYYKAALHPATIHNGACDFALHETWGKERGKGGEGLQDSCKGVPLHKVLLDIDGSGLEQHALPDLLPPQSEQSGDHAPHGHAANETGGPLWVLPPRFCGKILRIIYLQTSQQSLPFHSRQQLSVPNEGLAPG